MDSVVNCVVNIERLEQRILSIQSHVVRGYVGNKTATFPLNVLGFEVDPINSVHFSNHTGYAHVKGQVLKANDLSEIFSGLVLNQFHMKYTHVLTGYIGSMSFLERVCNIIRDIKEANPDLIYVCDPVLGDSGRLYVSEDLIPVYRKSIIPLADIVTPNQFEAEIITQMKINNIEDALKVIDILHEIHTEIVVLSSLEIEEDVLMTIGSIKKRKSKERFQIKVPKIPIQFTGTGDLFSALFLAWISKTNKNLEISLEKTVATIQDVIKRTYEYFLSRKGPENYERLELKLIQSKADIECPKTKIRVEKLNF